MTSGRLCFFILVIMLALQPNSARAGYRGKMSGKSQMEREIRWLWKYVKEFALSCSRSNVDCQDPELKRVAGEIADYAPAFDERDTSKWDGLLEFVSEKEKPGQFSSALGEAHRTMTTGLTRFSQVLVNMDRVNLPLEVLVGLLAHEAAHHLGYTDDTTRMPDRFGAEISKHFSHAVQQSSLGQFNLPNTHVVTFNSEAAYRGSFGFISWGDWTSDVDWQPTPLQPVCRGDELMNRELVSAPIWRVNHINEKLGIVTVRGGGYVKAVCVNRVSAQARTSTLPLTASMELQFKKPFDADNWLDEIPTPIFEGAELTPSTNSNDNVFGLAQTFLIDSVIHEKTKLQAGAVWRTQIVLRSADDFIPTTCQVYAAGTQYAVITQDHLPGVNPFTSCNLKKLSDQTWQVDADLQLPKNMRPDRYYIPVILLSNPTSDRSAVPVLPKFITVENLSAPPPPVIEGVSVTGLKAASKLGTLDLTNSYQAVAGQRFQLEFTVKGRQTALDNLWFDLRIWTPGRQEFEILQGTGSSISFPQVVKNVEFLPTAAGTHIVWTFEMPTRLAGVPVAALKFRRFYVRTSDFSWAEIDLPGFHDHFVINSTFGK